MYVLQFDGMLQAMDQWAGKMDLLGYGWLIQRNGIEIAHGFGIFVRMGMTGSNAAEYLALIEGLEALADLKIRNEPIEIRGDAKCVIDQMTGSASVSSFLTRKLNRRAQKIMRRFTSLTWAWVPRQENKHADALSRRGLRYLYFTSSHKRGLDITQPGFFHGGSMVPLVDLRVHSRLNQPITPPDGTTLKASSAFDKSAATSTSRRM